MHLHHFILINRPVADVWEFLKQPNSEAAWHPALVEEKMTSEAGLQVGATGVQVWKVFGRRVESPWEITELEPGRKITTRSTSGPTAWEGTYLLEPSGEATRFTLDLRQEATGLGRLLAPLTDGLFRRQWMSDLALLKQVVEARRPAGG